MKHISVSAFKEVVEAEKGNQTIDFINVCTPVEYKERHIPGVRSVPLDELDRHISEFKGKKTIYVHCRSGNRSQKAVEKLAQLGVQAELVNVEGGQTAWESQLYPLNTTNRMPLMRQTLIAAGLIVLLGNVLSVFVDPAFLLLSFFMGGGLVFAGTTGWCGLSFALSHMPWNR